jgi:hypothetical protein
MKWQCFGFIVPPSLLLVFPEFSLVRRGWRYAIYKEEKMDLVELNRVGARETAHEL